MAEAHWTWMVYLAGDNNLSTAGDEDLEQMRRVGSTESVHLLAQFDNAGKRGTLRHRIGRDGRGEQSWKLPESDSGDPDVLVDFVRWAHEKFPARRYGLVLWNHGGGWEPSEMDRVAKSVGSAGFTVREASMRAASPLRRLLFRPALARLLAQQPNVRAICSDDGSGHSLDTVELGRALGRIREILGQPVDLLGMDACLMSNLEVAVQAAPHARFLVASEELEPGEGWPYDRALEPLVARPELPTVELASHLVEAYIDSYAQQPAARDVTQAALDLARVGGLTAAVDQLAGALLAEMPTAATWLWKAQKRSTGFFEHTLWDLDGLCAALAADSAPAVADAARQVRTALAPGPGSAVVAARARGKRVEKCGGVSVYLPLGAAISPFYGEVDFARANRWSRLLDAYGHA
jgi:hypothetical protein